MRFKVKPLEPPIEGSMRVVKRFLFLPRCIGAEVRWLEMARIEQVMRRGHGLMGTTLVWRDDRWEDD